MPKYANKNMHEICIYMQNHAEICSRHMPKYAIEISIKFASICRNMQLKICNNMQ